MARPDVPTATNGRANLRVLQVIHGYPPHYMAGSEVYTRSLVRELARHATVAVFTRVENTFEPPYAVADCDDDGVWVRRVNKPFRDYRFEDKYLDPRMDDAFRQMMREFRPDVVHVGHLSHLSTGIVGIARSEFQVPVVLTLHDYWLSCFRGQLVDPTLQLCSGPSDAGCLSCASASYKSTVDLESVKAYRSHMENVVRDVDLLLAPSRTVEAFFREQGVPAEKIAYSPYGFERDRVTTAPRAPAAGGIRFGFLGRVIPVKGIAHLIRAFRATHGPARLCIHGTANGQEPFLREIAGDDARIEFHGAYENDQLGAVLSELDAVVVPSLWIENAPLVIQEARLAGLPVIASDAGGMAELVRDGVDGYVFPLGDEPALSAVLQRLIDEPERLTALDVDRGSVRDIADDAQSCLRHYRRLCAPRRLTVVTNPGLCNLACPMCDTHSVFAPEGHAKDLPMLDWPVVESTLRELARVGLREVIPSTMGEPLMYPAFDQLLALLDELGLTLNLTTNGTWPRGGVERWAPKLLPVLSDVKVSLNGVDPAVNERVMTGAHTDRQLASLEEFLRLRDKYAADTGKRPTVTVQATFMEANLAGLPDIVRWAAERGVDRFKGHHLWVTWSQLEGESLRRSRDAARRWNDLVPRLREIAATVDGPGGRHIRLENVEILDEGSPDGPPADTECPFLGREAWLEADGSFQVCCCPSEKRKAFGDFGNVRDRSFARLWSDPGYREFVASWGEHPNCLGCNMRRPRQEREDA